VSDDRQLIRDLVENWAIWRDAGDWERFATAWHDDGFMMATWFQGPAREFIRVSREGFERGVSILHFLGGTSIDVAGDRAIAQTKMTISQRAEVHGVLCDVVCTGRFYDFLERRPPPVAPSDFPERRQPSSAPSDVPERPPPATATAAGPNEMLETGSIGEPHELLESPSGGWGIVLRQPVYEKDRLDPIDPSATLELDPERLAQFPDGYRHLGYIQSALGFDVKRDMPGLTGPAVQKLYARGRDWLAGGDLGDPLSTT
jgi:SnoaL-like domain